MTEEAANTDAPDNTDAADDIPSALQLDLPSYSGPIDLLVDLIRQQQIDVFDIPIALITRQYLEYIDRMKALDLSVGGEWLEMAATLVHIKSRLLLPDDPEEDEEEGPDPRDELVRRLVEHEMFQWAAERLEERPQLERDFLMAAPKARDQREQLGPPRLRQASLFDLVDALKRVIEVQEAEDTEWVHEVTQQKLTLKGVILDIANRLEEEPRIRFHQLFEDTRLSRHRVVTTFLALLEMTRLDMLRLFQPRLEDESRGELLIERAVIDIKEVSTTLDLPEMDG